MRDPDRISIILGRLQKVWERNPDLRLSQLLINVIGDSSAAYYLEDKLFMDKIEDYYKVENNQGEGAWIRDVDNVYRCSKCKEVKPSAWFPRYCPYCGEKKSGNIKIVRPGEER
jgi:uncharacterized protein YihD (DUF1040 family)